MKEVVIVSAVRTPFGKFGGALKNVEAVELGGVVIKAALERANIKGEQVDEVIMGMVVPAGAGQIPGRQASILGGIPHDVPVVTINKVCGSALKAVTMAAQMIKAGDADIVVSKGQRWGTKMGNQVLVDSCVNDGLWCPENDVHMAVIGGQVAAEYDVTREDQDKWAFRSQRRWQIAEEKMKFKDEIVPVEIKSKKGMLIFDKDEFPRPDTTLESLAKLSPVFDEKGTVTAGNSPGINDGASAVIVMSKDRATELGMEILATIKGYAQVARESRYISTVPGLAINKLLKRIDKKIEEIDLIEINEAFAAVPLVSAKIAGIDQKTMDDKVNVNGSAVAVGHPIGATGARILMTLIYELRRSGKKNGICAICSGMAQGDAVYIEV